MAANPLTSADVYTDLSGLQRLRSEARGDGKAPETLRKVAAQFEALFTQMMLKSMRAASPGDPLFGSDQENFYRDMFDQQMSVSLSQGRGLGLADVLVRQLSGQLGAAPAEATKDAAGPAPAAGAAGRDATSPAGFVRQLWSGAKRAAAELGVAPEGMVAQAALETGWGRHMIRHPDGSNSYNLFGIKADRSWQGARVSVPTVEYRDGVALRTRAEFRAYSSYAESMQDYVRFLKTNPRYQDALATGNGDALSFLKGLHAAGYATDPAYVDKLGSILKGDTLGDALAALKISGDQPLTG